MFRRKKENTVRDKIITMNITQIKAVMRDKNTGMISIHFIDGDVWNFGNLPDKDYLALSNRVDGLGR